MKSTRKINYKQPGYTFKLRTGKQKGRKVEARWTVSLKLFIALPQVLEIVSESLPGYNDVRGKVSTNRLTLSAN